MPNISKITLPDGVTYDLVATALDTKVTQNNSTDNADYRVLLSKSANNTTETDEINKNASLKYNPSNEKLTLGSRSETFTMGETNLSIGRYNSAYGKYSIVVGDESYAGGNYSLAVGNGVKANSRSQFAFGEYNIADNSGSASSKGDYIEIVGNGTGDSTLRSNARTLDWDGNEVLAGTLETPDIVKPTGSTWDGTNASLTTAIISLISTLNNKANKEWIGLGTITQTGSFTLAHSVNGLNEIMMALVYSGTVRQSVTAPKTYFTASYMFPDFLIATTRIYMGYSYIDDTHINVTSFQKGGLNVSIQIFGR